MTKNTTAIATTNEVPSYLKDLDGPARGSEGVSSDDIILPRIAQLQALSPQLEEDSPVFVEGAKQGDFINTLTMENYGQSLLFIPVYFKKEYIVWKDRKKGGGFFGAHDTKREALAAINALEPPYDDYDATETVSQFVMIIKDGALTEAILSMAKTKLSTSRKLQSLIRLSGRDSFACQYKLDSMKDKSDLGTFYNTKVSSAGFVPEEFYYAAETCYNSITAEGSRYSTAEQAPITPVSDTEEAF